jgi:hypothetical protein
VDQDKENRDDCRKCSIKLCVFFASYLHVLYACLSRKKKCTLKCSLPPFLPFSLPPSPKIYTRDWYSISSVSITTFSPTSTKGGTLIISPFPNVAGLNVGLA